MFGRERPLRSYSRTVLFSASYLALAVAGASQLWAQDAEPPSTAPAGQPSDTNNTKTGEPGATKENESQLPSLRVDEPNRKPRISTPQPSKQVTTAAPARQAPRRETPRTAAKPTRSSKPQTAPATTTTANGPWAAQSQAARTGTVGVYSNSTSVATKVNTPLVNIPQSVSVLTKDFIRDQALLGVTDLTRYVPGVAVHQGEGNRDELIIRGVDSSANFFVNGFRDDVQYFRDLYNAQSVEILRGPSALTFGRGVGGGLLNRTLKEADGTRVYDATFQTGSFGDRRFTLDAGQAVNENVAVRLNIMDEESRLFRDYNELGRYGVNPTITFLPDDNTKVRFSYEYFHDERTADRGNPSQALSAVPPSSTRGSPAYPFAPNGDLSTFYGSPDLNIARAYVQTTMAIIDHDFQNGLTVKNGTIYADYTRRYQNVYPGNGPLSGAVYPDDSKFNLAAYQHTTDRQNVFNQTDFIYKTYTGPLFHTFAFGSEIGREAGIDVRNTGIFANGTNTTIADPFNPTYFGPIYFVHQYPGAFSPGVSTADGNSRYRANLSSAYVRDTLDVTPWLQLIAGARFENFDLWALDMNTGTPRVQDNSFISPSFGTILKPWSNVSLYYTYMKSYLPASGDQFSALNNGNVILAPQEFESNEVGFKWNINPRLLYTAAAYDLDRKNVPLPDPSNPGFFILSGRNEIRGFESSLVGYMTDAWQSTLGYAYTDARVTGATSPTIVVGNRIQLVPFNQFSYWNKYQINPFWGAALGVIYFSDSFASSDDSVKLPGFWRFDAGVFLTISETWRAQFNVENLFDRGYWASADGNNNISPGAGRTFRLSATARF
jgi:catecholate siderophore receptor